MPLKHKIAALSILPLLLAVAVVGALVLFQNQRLGEQHQPASASSKTLVTLDGGVERLAGAIGEVRRISNDLRPSLLDTLWLSAAIGQHAAEFEQRSGLNINGLELTLSLYGRFPDIRVADSDHV